MAVKDTGIRLELRCASAGWPALWRDFLRELGLYDQYRHEKNDAKRGIINAELMRFGGHLEKVDMGSVVFWFPNEESLMHFRMVWT